MTVRRFMGVENEYGLLAAGPDAPGAREAAELLVRAYSAAGPGRGRSVRPVVWDYGGENPLQDVRGGRLERSEADASQLTDDPDAHGAARSVWCPPAGFTRRPRLPVVLGGRTEELLRPEEAELLIRGIPNVVLTNGARLYVDHAHPEYAGPECDTPRDVVLWDRAGDLVMRRAMAVLERAEGLPEVVTYKNNVDGKGATYGCHDNYALRREVPFEDVVDVLTVHLATRPILCGTGRVGIGPRSEEAGFQIFQRADYVDTHVALQTTYDRPLVNTRDEPHADPRDRRRIHVIQGDATSFDVSTLLKVGTTSLLLWVLDATVEEGLGPAARAAVDRVRALVPADPPAAVRHVSRDLTLRAPFPLAAGGEASALEVQRALLAVVRDLLGAAAALRGTPTDAPTTEVLARWGEVLDGLAENPASVAGQVEWVAKHLLLDGLRRRTGAAWDDPRIVAADLQWHDMRPARSLVRTLEAAGRVERLLTDEEIARAEVAPPRTTRAYLRGEALRRYPNGIASASWGSLVLDVEGHEHVVRVPMHDPADGSAERTERMLDDSPMVEDLLDHLVGGHYPRPTPGPQPTPTPATEPVSDRPTPAATTATRED